MAAKPGLSRPAACFRRGDYYHGSGGHASGRLDVVAVRSRAGPGRAHGSTVVGGGRAPNEADAWRWAVGLMEADREASATARTLSAPTGRNPLRPTATPSAPWSSRTPPSGNTRTASPTRRWSPPTATPSTTTTWPGPAPTRSSWTCSWTTPAPSSCTPTSGSGARLTSRTGSEPATASMTSTTGACSTPEGRGPERAGMIGRL
jgi:hypothetical protein